MTNQECKTILEAVGTCLCGHGESCGVCSRSEAQRAIEQRCREQLKKAGCGTKWSHRLGYANICIYCGFWKKSTPIRLKKRF